ncbi:MAG: RidA family protein, partial [Candidatus Kapaibacterium sp.]
IGEDGSVLEYDVRVQTLSVFENIRFILEDAGATWEDIVDVQVYLTDMKTDFPVFNALYAEHFRHIQATRTTIEVGALPTPIAVELKVVAVVTR